MSDVQAQTTEAMRQIIAIVGTITGLKSRWSGILQLVPDADFKGKKRFSCDIQLDASLAVKDERWSTMIHEALHSVSVGYNSSDFQIFKGWEEGTVEQLQRLIRADVLAQIGIEVPADTFVANDRFHAFNRFIDSLERIRTSLNVAEDQRSTFYIGLLGVSIRDRTGYVLKQAQQTEGALRFEFVKTFAAANAVLMGGAR
jgi:hypothetical protein